MPKLRKRQLQVAVCKKCNILNSHRSEMSSCGYLVIPQTARGRAPYLSQVLSGDQPVCIFEMMTSSQGLTFRNTTHVADMASKGDVMSGWKSTNTLWYSIQRMQTAYYSMQHNPYVIRHIKRIYRAIMRQQQWNLSRKAHVLLAAFRFRLQISPGGSTLLPPLLLRAEPETCRELRDPTL